MIYPSLQIHQPPNSKVFLLGKHSLMSGYKNHSYHAEKWRCTHSVQFSCSVVSDSLQPHGVQHARVPVHHSSWSLLKLMSIKLLKPSNISSSIIPFFSCLQSFPASGSFPVSQFFASGGQSIGVSALASVHPVNIQDWLPLELTGLILPLGSLLGDMHDIY